MNPAEILKLDAERAAKELRERHGDEAEAVVADLIRACGNDEEAILILRQIAALLRGN